MPSNKIYNKLLQIAAAILILVFLNLISSRYFKRFDLTEDERFSVSDATVELLHSLDGSVMIDIYFAGEMPTQYTYLQDGIRTFLIELSNYSNGNLDFQFIDPADDKEIFNYFIKKGYEPFRLVDVTGTSMKDQFVLPFAVIHYKGGEEQVVNLIKGCVYNNMEERKPDINIEKALQNLEYNLVSSIYALTRDRTSTIGLLKGHGEYTKEMMADLYPELNQYYNLIEVDLSNRAITPQDMDLLMVLQPDTVIGLREKYEIDQYLMRGGKVIFMMDPEIVDFTMDSQASTLTVLRDVRLDDLFSAYGIKLNYNIVEDLRCGYIDAASSTATFGNSMTAKPWTFHPLIFPKGKHPVVRNVSDVLIRFGSSIDTFALPGVSHKVMLQSSPYTKVRERVQYINIDQHLTATAEPDRKAYRSGPQIFGITTGGQLKSAFAGRQNQVSTGTPFLAETKTPGVDQIAVIADGEFAIGEIREKKMFPLPSDNKTFVMNLVDYLTGQEMLTKIRVRKMVARRLNPQAVEGNESAIQVMNILLPVLLVMIYGLVRRYFRVRRNKALQLAKPGQQEAESNENLNTGEQN